MNYVISYTPSNFRQIAAGINATCSNPGGVQRLQGLLLRIELGSDPLSDQHDGTIGADGPFGHSPGALWPAA